MATCTDCGLDLVADSGSNQDRPLCEPCTQLSDSPLPIRITPISENDLELVYAWRSNPEIYRHFRQQDGPLVWEDHVEWFHSRSRARHDFIIRFDNRRVGVVSLDDANEVGVLLGDYSARGHGVATAALHWLCQRFTDRRPLYAEIHDENSPSKRLFVGCGFEKSGRDGDWIRYVYDD